MKDEPVEAERGRGRVGWSLLDEAEPEGIPGRARSDDLGEAEGDEASEEEVE